MKSHKEYCEDLDKQIDMLKDKILENSFDLSESEVDKLIDLAMMLGEAYTHEKYKGV